MIFIFSYLYWLFYDNNLNFTLHQIKDSKDSKYKNSNNKKIYIT